MSADKEPLLGDEPKEETPIAKYVAIAVVAAVVAVLAYEEYAYVKIFFAAALAVIGSIGYAAIPVMILCCWVTTAVSGPAVIFEVNGGILFDSMYNTEETPYKGTVIAIFTVCLGVWLGCITAFELGRRYLKPKVESIIKENQTLSVINDIISEEGWKFAFLMRLNPLIPFEIFNYAVAMTNLSFAHNAIAALGTMPIVAFEVYSSVTAAQIAKQAASGGEDSGEAMREAGIKFVICAVLMVIIMLYGKKKYDDKVKIMDVTPIKAADHYKSAKATQLDIRKICTGRTVTNLTNNDV